MLDLLKEKTFKREYAAIFVVVLIYMIVVKNNLEMVAVIIWPLISFVAASAGLHIYGTSTTSKTGTTSTSTPSSK